MRTLRTLLMVFPLAACGGDGTTSAPSTAEPARIEGVYSFAVASSPACYFRTGRCSYNITFTQSGSSVRGTVRGMATPRSSSGT